MALKETLTKDAGPLPIWAWAGIGTVAIAGFMIYKKKQSMNAQGAANTNQAGSSNLGTTPISNLLVTAEPMPIETGPTFVSTPVSTTTTVTNNPVQTNNPSSGSLPPSPKPNPPPPPTGGPLSGIALINQESGLNLSMISSPTMSQDLQKKGYNVYTVGNAQYYNPAQKLTGSAGTDYTYLSSPSKVLAERAKGKKIVDLGKSQWVLGPL